MFILHIGTNTSVVFWFDRRGGAVGDNVRFVCGVWIPDATLDLSHKIKVVTGPLPNARQHVWVSRVFGDDHYKRMSRVTVIDISADHRSNCEEFHPNGDISVWVKKSRVGSKTLLMKHLLICKKAFLTPRKLLFSHLFDLGK